MCFCACQWGFDFLSSRCDPGYPLHRNCRKIFLLDFIDFLTNFIVGKLLFFVFISAGVVLKLLFGFIGKDDTERSRFFFFSHFVLVFGYVYSLTHEGLDSVEDVYEVGMLLS